MEKKEFNNIQKIEITEKTKVTVEDFKIEEVASMPMALRQMENMYN